MKAFFRLKSTGIALAALGAVTLTTFALLGELPLSSTAPELTASILKPQRTIKPRDEWFFRQRAYPLNDIPQEARQRGLFQAAAVPHFKAEKASATSPWRLVGPTGFESVIEPTWSRMSGRVRDLAIDPSNAQRLFLGTATGGVWRSTDGGESWQPLTDKEASLSIGAVAIAPSSPNTIYAGTGEGNGTYFSAGLLKSVDGGDTWSLLGLEEFGRGAISGLEVSPTDADRLVVCASDASGLNGEPANSGVAGIYLSTDGGSSFARGEQNSCAQLAVDPQNPQTLYYSAVLSGDANGLYKSTNGGASWARLDAAPQGPGLGRLAIGISSSGTTLYIGGAFDDGRTVLHKSIDSGATWNQLFPTGRAATYCEGQCGYNNVIAVDPSDDNDVFFGGVGLYRTLDGGQSFTTVGNNNDGGGPLHVDHHMLTFAAGGMLYSGNDGGIYRSSDDGTTWTGLGATLSTLQPYQLSLHPTDPEIMFIGAQDNGTQRRNGSNLWSERNGGDGGYSAIHPTQPQVVFGSTTNLNFFRSVNGGDTFSYISSDQMAEESRSSFIAPLILDRAQPNTLYAASYRIWKSTDQGNTWNTMGGDLTGGGTATVVHLAVAPSSSQILYAVTSDGKVQRSDNGGAAWNDITKAPLPNRWATSVAIDSADPNLALVTYSGFNTATPSAPGHVFLTTDGGGTWIDISSNLPDLPAQNIAIRPGDSQELYLATDGGVFITQDRGISWLRMDRNLPNAGVSSLALNATTNTLAAATYGRSVWVTSLADTGTQLAAGFSFTPPQPTAGQAVQFTDTSMGAPNQWSWSFGDGTTSTQQNPSHAYNQAGTYQARLEVSDGQTSDSMIRTVTVVGAEGGGCTPNAETLCLLDDRFSVRMTWTDLEGNSGVGKVAGQGTRESGLFYFFGPDNWEVLVKVLDGCGFNNRYWVFSAAATNVGYELRVEDTSRRTMKTYSKQPGPPAPALNDTSAFATCP